MNSNNKIRKKIKSFKKKIGSKEQKESLITKNHSYILVQNGIVDSQVLNTPSLSFFNNPDNNDAIKAYDKLEDQMIEEYNAQYNPMYWINQDIEYFKSLLRTISPKDQLVDDYKVGKLFILFEGETEPRLKPKEINTEDFINSVGKAWLSRESMSHIGYIKKNYPDHNVANYAAEALQLVNELSIIFKEEQSLVEGDLVSTFLHTRRIGELKNLILVKENEIAILTHKERASELNHRNRSNISLVEEKNIIKKVSDWYQNPPIGIRKHTHLEIINKIIKDTFNSGGLQDEYINDKNNTDKRKKSLSIPFNREALAKQLSKRHSKKSLRN